MERNEKGQFKKGHIPWIKGKHIKLNNALEEYYKNGGKRYKFPKGYIPWNKGISRSEETKQKISKTKKGNPTRYWLGKKFSKEHKRKLSEAGRGKFGKLARNWKGGLCKRRDERNDSLYSRWVRQVKRRDKNQCMFKGQNCSGYLIVHHILPWRDFPELRYNIKNGITLCQYHHPRKRVDEQRLIPFFQELVKSKELT